MARDKKRRTAIRSWFGVHKEALRNTLLVALTAGIVAQSGLLWSQVLTRDSIPWSGLRARVTASAQGVVETDNEVAALPTRFAVRTEDGMYGIQYNTDGLRTAYEETAELWTSALTNAAPPTVAAAADYRTALQGELALMEFDGSVPLDVLAGWLDCAIEQELASVRIGTAALCRTQDGYVLYLRDSASGQLVCAQTQVENELFDAAVQQFEPNDCVLAADEENTAVSPDLLYFRESETFDVLSFGAYDGGNIEVLLEAFGMDAAAAQNGSYTTQDGVQVYVSGEHTLRLLRDGSVQYDGSGLRLPASHGHDRLMQCIQTGYDLTLAALGAVDSGAQPALINAYTDADSGRYVAVYGIQVNGVPVDNAVTGYFARYEFEGGAMVRANLALRTCQTTGETIAVMPERQAAASLAAQTDAVLSLRYIDSAKGTASEWDSEAYADSADGALWEAENTEQTDDETLNTAWYDSTGEPVSPQWYILRYDDSADLEQIARTLSPEDIVVVQADFDRLIQGG